MNNTPNQSEARQSELSFNDRDSLLGEQLLRYANVNDAKMFEAHLGEFKDYEILKVSDKKSYTRIGLCVLNPIIFWFLVLHICCLNNNEEIFDSLLNYVL